MSGNINVGAGLVPALKFKFLLTRATTRVAPTGCISLRA